MTRMRSNMLLFVVCVAALLCAPCAAQTINAKQIDDKTIRVTVPGRFETDFTKRKGFGHTWYDLKHDPEKIHNLAPVDDENGFFWIKNGPGPERPAGGRSWYANPAKAVRLVEANPVRARVRLKGVHMCYGKPWKKMEWPELGFELTWTIYPTGHVFGDYTLVADQPVKLHHFLAIIKSTGHWGPLGTGVGKGEIHPASEAGDGVKPSGRKPCAWVLQHSNGPTHFTDILMVFQDGKYGGTYWNMGYRDRDYRTGLNILAMFPDKAVPAGGMHIPVMFRIAEDMSDVKTAALHANAYRAPGKLTVTQGKVVTDDAGDYDGDGYNESEGCYVLRSTPVGVAFTLPGAKTPRMTPAFKILDWKGEAPKAVVLGARDLALGTHFNATVTDGVLVVQILSDVSEDASLAIKQGQTRVSAPLQRENGDMLLLRSSTAYGMNGITRLPSRQPRKGRKYLMRMPLNAWRMQ